MNKKEQNKEISEFQFIQPEENSWKLNNDVHVWKFPLLPMMPSLLTGEEKMIAGRFRQEGDRYRFVTGRQALRLLVSNYLSVRPMDIEIISEKGRKPFISKPASDILFNISHSGEWVLIALAQHELGIDLEKINPEFDFGNLFEDHFSEDEQDYISAASDVLFAFFYLWTRKEALIKAWGTGLQDHMKWIPVLNVDSYLDRYQKSWKIESFQLSPFYPAALAYSGQLESLKYLDGSFILNN